MAVSERFLRVLKNLSPKGRLFRLAFGSDADKFYRAHTAEYERLAERANLVRNAGLPGRIPEEALSDWEEFLNLLPGTRLSVQQQNKRIIGKYSQVGGQGPEYIQDILQKSGFPLYVYENRADEGVKTPLAVLGTASLGSFTLGEYTDRIDPRSLAGHLYAGPPRFRNRKDYTLGEPTTVTEEVPYVISADSTKYIFFIFLAGPGGIYDFVDIPEERENDLKLLLYEIKPGNVWVLAQINLV
jgi:hypothetical protein